MFKSLLRSFFVTAAVLSAYTSCSPSYVLQASWEEMQILRHRQPLAELIASPETPAELKKKFELVLAVREFSSSVGLLPAQSYTKYSDVKRDVLVWVLSASSKLSLTPKTWWFPVVGRIPYKGFFDKEQGLAEAEQLKASGLDIYLRPSPAFSTLGWFDDPLLSTLTKYDQVILANTVIHEILHNTIWITNHASFNETLANFVGNVGAVEFFSKKEGPQSENFIYAHNLQDDELLYAHFIAETYTQLMDFYSSVPKEFSSCRDKDCPADLLEKRRAIFDQAISKWTANTPRLKSKNFTARGMKLNNAVLLAEQVYLDKIWLFNSLYEECGNSLETFLQEMLQLSKKIKQEDLAPYSALSSRIDELKAKRRDRI